MITGQLSEKDVRLARMEQKCAELRQENEQLRRKCDELQLKYEQAVASLENERYSIMWLKMYIRLSREKVASFFKHTHDLRVAAIVQAFLLKMLPNQTTADEVLMLAQATELPDDDGRGNTYVSGNLMDIHDNEEVRYGQ